MSELTFSKHKMYVKKSTVSISIVSTVINHFLRSSLAMLLLFCSCAIWGQSNYIVKTNKLNVRNAPNTNATIAGTLTQESLVSVIDISNGWATINFEGKTCYVSAKYLEKVSDENKDKKEPSVEVTPTVPKPEKKESSTYNHVPEITKRPALWNFSAGAMPHTSKYEEKCFDWFVQLGGDIPITIDGKPFTIDASLRYLNKRSVVSYNRDYYIGNANFLEVPIHLSYDLPLANNLDLRFSAGPYFSYMFNADGGTHIGIEPSVALKYKNFSLGLQYSVPLHKDYTNEISNVAMLTLGIRFNNKAWKYIGAGLLVAGTAAIAINEALDKNSESDEGSYNDNGVAESLSSSGMLSVSGLITKEENAIRQLENEISAENRRVESYHNQTTTTTRINGKIVKVPAKGAKPYQGKGQNGQRYIPNNVKRKVINDHNRNIKWLRSLQSAGTTEISKERWNNYLKGKQTADDNYHKRKLKNKGTHVRSYTYEYWESLLQRYNSGESDYNESDVKHAQEEMRKLRKKGTGSKYKSKWEDWDGVPGSM